MNAGAKVAETDGEVKNRGWRRVWVLEDSDSLRDGDVSSEEEDVVGDVKSVSTGVIAQGEGGSGNDRGVARNL